MMDVIKTERGFELIYYPAHGSKHGTTQRLVQQSSAINPNEADGFRKPGSSYLWFGEHHHLDRDEVEALVGHLQSWLTTGSLSLKQGDDVQVFIEPLHIGSETGPTVYILVRQVGRHKDVEQMPDEVNSTNKAHAYAAKRWNVPECDVKWKPGQVINLED